LGSKSLQLERELPVEGFHVCFACIKPVYIGVETTVMALGITVGDMEIE
jgi:hypothetical protein